MGEDTIEKKKKKSKCVCVGVGGGGIGYGWLEFTPNFKSLRHDKIF